jgi:hypothetical protein
MELIFYIPRSNVSIADSCFLLLGFYMHIPLLIEIKKLWWKHMVMQFVFVSSRWSGK